MKPLKNNVYLKLAAIIIIALLLQIPTAMIKSLIFEREETQRQAIHEVSSKWGHEQTITGPFITIPFLKQVKEYSDKDGSMKLTTVKDYIHILPDELTIKGEIRPEKRERSIYEIVVYESILQVSGKFNKLNLESTDVPIDQIQFDKAFLTIGISDLRGIKNQIELDWNMQSVVFNPGLETNHLVSSGLQSNVTMNYADSADYSFSFNLNLKGSQFLYFTPVGKTTNIQLTSKWPNPSFNGAFLPDTRTTDDTGFAAQWQVLHLNRNYPQTWIGSKHSLTESAFGVDLLLPVDNYQKSYRSIRYAILFIGFTFLVFFFIEVLNKVFIHPIQYILVGIALVVFYTLLLSTSEYLTFNSAFILSAIATLLLIAGYVKAILRSNQITFLISGILTILYSFIFVIIQLQDYALLIGSIGIFIILGLVMYFSRKIDWYNLNQQNSLD